MNTTPPARFHGLNDDETVTHHPVNDSTAFDDAMDEAGADLAQGTTRTLRRDKTADGKPGFWPMWGLPVLVGLAAGVAFLLMCLGVVHLAGMVLGWDGVPR